MNGTNDSSAPYNGGGGFMSVEQRDGPLAGLRRMQQDLERQGDVRGRHDRDVEHLQERRGRSVRHDRVGSHTGPGRPSQRRHPNGQLDATSAISSFILSVPHAAAPTAPALTASISSVSVKQGKPRRIVVKLASNTAGTLRATLAPREKGAGLARLRCAGGHDSLSLPLSTRVKSGSYHLTLALKTASGPKIFQRSVRIPR